MESSPDVREVVRIYRVGPRKVCKLGDRAGIYLPKCMNWLRGALVNLTIEVLELPENEGN